jgi:hypothetical protein
MGSPRSVPKFVQMGVLKEYQPRLKYDLNLAANPGFFSRRSAVSQMRLTRSSRVWPGRR